MTRLFLMSFLFLLSLLNVFRAPLNILWYVSILTTEFCWIFLVATGLLLAFSFGADKYVAISNFVGLAAAVCFALPIFHALRISSQLPRDMTTAFRVPPANLHKPFSLGTLVLGHSYRAAKQTTYTYDTAHQLTLDLYASAVAGRRPCVLVIHGGSWAGGSKEQLPALNSYLASRGYHVAAMNYRLAPEHRFPAPIEDVASAIAYLQAESEKLGIDTQNIVLLGRSAGAQVALVAAYTLKNPAVRGVISYYGPTDMIWGYKHRANPLVLDSRGVMEKYLGGTYSEIPHVYASSSAMEVADKYSVPTLLIQGRNDPLVAYDHCNRLDRRLTELGVNHFVLRLPWATHGCDFNLSGPAGQLSIYATCRFLASITTR